MWRWALRYFCHLVGVAVCLSVTAVGASAGLMVMAYLTDAWPGQLVIGLNRPENHFSAMMLLGALYGLALLPGLVIMAMFAALPWPSRARRPDILALWLLFLPITWVVIYAVQMGLATSVEGLVGVVLLLLTLGFWWMVRAHMRALEFVDAATAARFD